MTTETERPAKTSHQAGAPWTLPEAAKFLGVCRSTLEKGVRANTVKVFKMRNLTRIADEEVHRIAKEGF